MFTKSDFKDYFISLLDKEEFMHGFIKEIYSDVEDETVKSLLVEHIKADNRHIAIIKDLIAFVEK